MARRKDHTREELETLALGCARELVRTSGVRALTARAVAARMGYTAGTLYNLFPGIDALAEAVNTSCLLAFAQTLQEERASHGKPRKQIQAIAKAYLRFQEKEPELWSLLFASSIPGQSDDYREAVRAVFGEVVAAFRPLSGSEDAARRDAKILWATLHGLCLLQRDNKLGVAGADSAKDLVKQFLTRYLSPGK